jgi:hypothetical protein
MERPPTLGLYPTHNYVQYLKAKFMRGLIHGGEEKIMELRYVQLWTTCIAMASSIAISNPKTSSSWRKSSR